MRTPEPDRAIYVVVPVRNRLPITRACLETLGAQSLSHTVVVVDDGSSDGTPEMVASDFPHVVLLRGDGNLWWTGATNRGVAWVLDRCRSDDLVVTLNDDTLLPPNYLQLLTSPSASDPRSLVGSVAVKVGEPDVILDGGVRVDWWRAKFIGVPPGQTLIETFPHRGLRDVDVLSGCGTLIAVRAFRELGLYNARRLPHYGADYEFSRRAARAGYRLVVNTAAVLERRDSTGIHAAVGSARPDTLVRSFVSRRSATNLAMRVNFGLLAAPRRVLVPFLVCDLGRVVLGSLRRFIRRAPLR